MQIHLKAAPAEKEASRNYIADIGTVVNQKNLILSIIWIGIFLRLFHFFDNRSLWRDEIYLATSLIEMDLFNLIFSPLEYEQKAPIGFLWFSKLGVLLLGKGEMGLRLIPLLSGILSLFVFLPVARYFLKPLGVLVAMVMLAFAPPIIFHSVEAKQYSTELLATVVVFYLFIKYKDKADIKALVVWGILGVLVLCFSLSSIFVLAGIAFGLCLSYLLEKNWDLLFRSLIPFSLWFFGFVGYYLLFLNRYADSEWLVHWFELRGGFMPLAPSSVADVKWFLHAVYDLQRYPLGLMWIDFIHPNPIVHVLVRMPLLPLIFFFAGIWMFLKENKNLLVVLLLPLFLTLLASGVKVYPFYERLIVFLAPIFIILVAGGCAYLTKMAAKWGNWRYVLPALLLAVPVISSARQVIEPGLFGDYKRSQQRSAFLYINERMENEDLVYINWNSLHAYRFYNHSYDLQLKAIEGKDPRFISANYEEYFTHLKPDLDQLSGKKRVWLVYHKRVWDKIGDFDGEPAWYYEAGVAGGGELLHEKFSQMGKEIDNYQTGEFNVSLFDFSVK